MARRSRTPGSSQFRLDRSERSGNEIYITKTPGDFERKCFEFDRKLVVAVINTLRDAIDEGAKQMSMLADERVFDESTSRTCSRTAQRLNRMVAELQKLLTEVGGATGYPKFPINAPAAHAVVRHLPTRT